MIHEHIDSVNRYLLAPVFGGFLFGRIHLTFELTRVRKLAQPAVARRVQPKG